jgi:hypothetical protein
VLQEGTAVDGWTVGRVADGHIDAIKVQQILKWGKQVQVGSSTSPLEEGGKTHLRIWLPAQALPRVQTILVDLFRGACFNTAGTREQEERLRKAKMQRRE